MLVSDNASGMHADVLAALARANAGHVLSYGDDPCTAHAVALLRRHFGAQAEVLLALTGTGANVLALQSVLHSHQAVICADSAHLNRDECGALEKFTGSRLLTVPHSAGKLTAAAIAPLLTAAGNVHRVQPRVVSITQCTEWGTVYEPAELRALADFCHRHDLLLHVDGARLCNAAAALETDLHALTTACGVDLLSFGLTKNGALGAESVVFLAPELAETARFVRKQAMQLASKMRFVAAQFEALLEGDLWRRNAAHANAMAVRLADGVAGIPALEIAVPVETNAVFVRLPPHAIPDLQAASPFVLWDPARAIARWMTSFDTTPDEVDAFVERVRETCAAIPETP